MGNWNIITNALLIVVKKTFREVKNQTKPWYNILCKNAVFQQNEGRLKYLKAQTQVIQEAFERQQKKCKSIIQR